MKHGQIPEELPVHYCQCNLKYKMEIENNPYNFAVVTFLYLSQSGLQTHNFKN